MRAGRPFPGLRLYGWSGPFAVPVSLRRTAARALWRVRDRTRLRRDDHPVGSAPGTTDASSRTSIPGFFRTAALGLSRMAMAVGCLSLAGCLAILESKYTFHDDGTGEAEYVTRFDAEMVFATETGPCQWRLSEETDHRVEIIEDNLPDETRRGEWVRCTHRLGPIPSEELLQRALDGRGFGRIDEGWFSSTLELDALDSKQVLERMGYCDGNPCPGFEFTLMEFSMLDELAKPSEASTPEAPRTKLDDFAARTFHCKLEVGGDGVDSVEGLEFDEADGVYRYTGDCRTSLGTAMKWSVER